MKQWDWQTIIDFGNSLEEFNEKQWRFLKGLILELAIEKHSNDPTLKYVGQVHRDYDWHKHNVSVELKTNMTTKMYKRQKVAKGQYTQVLKDQYSIILTNSMGTNKRLLNAHEIADYVVVPMGDGAFLIDRNTAFACQHFKGDGISLKVSKDQIVELTGPVAQKTKFNTVLKQAIMTAISTSLP